MKLLAERLASRIPIVSLILSFIVAWIVVPAVTGFPMIAFVLFAVGLSSLVYLLRKKKSWLDSMLFAGILLLSFFTIYRANGFLQFFDVVFILFFGSLLVHPLIHERGVFSILFSPLIVFKNTFTTKNIFPYVFKSPIKTSHIDSLGTYLPTIAVTALVMLITIPLLASANPFFNALLQDILHFFNLEWLRYIFADSLAVYVFRGLVLLCIAFFIPRVLSLSLQEVKSSESKQLFAINYLIPKIAMAGLLIIFFITQIQLYFASAQTLQSMGYTNSRLTNEVFAQVTIVAFIVFLLAYFDKSRKVWNTRLTYFLVIEAFFLIAIAFKSVYDYASLYGFTQKRLWGYTTMTWLTGALGAFVYHYIKQTPNLHFVKQIITYTLGIVLLVNILNFDHLIYRYAKPTTSAGIDYTYIAGLSVDAHYYKEVLDKSMAEAEKSNFRDDTKTFPVYIIIGNINSLRYKYKTIKEFNSFNIAEYQEYLATKDINVDAYSKKIMDAQQKHTQKEQTKTSNQPSNRVNDVTPSAEIKE